MYQKLDFALGFFITMIFLSSVVVTLTILYFSRSKPKNRVAQNDKGTEKPIESNTGGEPNSIVESIKLNINDPVPDTSIPLDLLVQTTSENSPLNGNEPTERMIVDKIDTVYKQSVENQPEKIIISKLSNINSPLPPAFSVEKQQPQKISLGNENNEATSPKDIHGALNETVASPTTAEAKTNISIDKLSSGSETNLKKGVNTNAPLIEETRESEVIEPMVDERKNPQPRDGQDDMGFSELFTEDSEETHAGRLSKDLSDIEANDILTMGQSLVSQFKGRR